jgi:hypothetical protein
MKYIWQPIYSLSVRKTETVTAIIMILLGKIYFGIDC